MSYYFDVAEKVIADIERAIGRLSRFQWKGHARPDLTDRDLLFYLVGSYFVIYRTHKKPLSVARILHTSRDIATLLRDG